MKDEKKYRSYGTTAAAWVLHNSQVGFFEPSLYCLLRRLDPRQVADAVKDTILYSIKVNNDSYAKRLIPIFIRAVCDREYFSLLVPVKGETETYQFKSDESAQGLGSCMAVSTELIKLYKELPVQEPYQCFGKPLRPGALETKTAILTEGFRYVQDDLTSLGRSTLIEFILEWHSLQDGKILEQEEKMWEGVLRDVVKSLRSKGLGVLAQKIAESKSLSSFRYAIMRIVLITHVKDARPEDVLTMIAEMSG